MGVQDTPKQQKKNPSTQQTFQSALQAGTGQYLSDLSWVSCRTLWASAMGQCRFRPPKWASNFPFLRHLPQACLGHQTQTGSQQNKASSQSWLPSPRTSLELHPPQATQEGRIGPCYTHILTRQSQEEKDPSRRCLQIFSSSPAHVTGMNPCVIGQGEINIHNLKHCVFLIFLLKYTSQKHGKANSVPGPRKNPMNT